MAEGIMLRHVTARSMLVLVPILSKPFPLNAIEGCPGCHAWHPCKTVHLIVNGDGMVMVSQGVLEDLRLAGMPNLEIIGTTNDPPPLHIGNGAGS